MSDYTHEIVQAIGFLSSEMTETRCQLRQALQDISDALNVPTPKRVRNEAARCGNCPYMAPCTNERYKHYGMCCLHPPIGDNEALVMPAKTWCGDHPDFWKEA